MLGSCDREYAMSTSGRCAKCPENAALSYLQVVAIVALVLASLALCLMFFLHHMTSAYTASIVARAILYVKEESVELKESVGAVFMIVIGAFQVRCVVQRVRES